MRTQTRRDFVKALALSAAAVAGVSCISGCAQFFQPAPPELQWPIVNIDEVLPEVDRRLGISAMIIVSPDFLEYFRNALSDGEGPWTYMVTRHRFSIEQYPYRYGPDYQIVSPYLTETTELGRKISMNPAWTNAPYEIIFAYAGDQVLVFHVRRLAFSTP